MTTSVAVINVNPYQEPILGETTIPQEFQEVIIKRYFEEPGETIVQYKDLVQQMVETVRPEDTIRLINVNIIPISLCFRVVGPPIRIYHMHMEIEGTPMFIKHPLLMREEVQGPEKVIKIFHTYKSMEVSSAGRLHQVRIVIAQMVN